MGNAMTNFRAEDMPGSAKLVAFTEGTKPKGDPEKEKVSVVDDNEVPKGTAKEVIEWAGDDPDRIQRALDTENAAEDPRSSLIEDLERAKRRAGAGDEPVQVDADDQAQAEERPQA
jgi:hypothetical protein